MWDTLPVITILVAGLPPHWLGICKSKRTGSPTDSGWSVTKNIPRREMFNVLAVCPSSNGEFIMQNRKGIFSL
jgi:hypothetical protein